MPRKVPTTVTGALWTLTFACALVLGLAWGFQRRLIYFPWPQEVPGAAEVLPGAEEISFATDDGLTLAGWFLRAGGSRPAPAVLVLNGNAGNRAFRAPLASALARAGLSVLLFDYRGYGGNPGRPTEAGLVADARAARAWLENTAGVQPERVALFGESLGAAVAAASAAERPPAALVLRSPFTSLADVGRFHYPFLPVRLLLADRYPVADEVRRLSCPLLVIAGDRDSIIPPAQSRAVFEAAPEPKRLLIVAGADHNDEELLSGTQLVREVTALLRRAAGEHALR